jgi:hypothetical protein
VLNQKANQMKTYILSNIFNKIKLNLIRSYFYILVPIKNTTIYSRQQSVRIHESHSHITNPMDEFRESDLTTDFGKQNSVRHKLPPSSQHNYESPIRRGPNS